MYLLVPYRNLFPFRMLVHPNRFSSCDTTPQHAEFSCNYLLIYSYTYVLLELRAKLTCIETKLFANYRFYYGILCAERIHKLFHFRLLACNQELVFYIFNY